MVVEDTSALSSARRAIEDLLAQVGLEEELTTSAQLVANELITNALIHAGSTAQVELSATPTGVKISVRDESALMPVVPQPSASGMTGRGLLLVLSLSANFGYEATPEGKVVWAELSAEHVPPDMDPTGLIEAWADDLDALDLSAGAPVDRMRHRIELGDIPTGLLLDAKGHVENLVREFQLAAGGAASGATAAVPPHMAEMIEAVVSRFSEARQSIKRQALDAARRGLPLVRLHLELPPEAAQAGEDYLRALDEADAYCRAARMLTLETPPRHHVFRHWYVGEIIAQLRRAEAGLAPAPVQTFEDRLLDEIDEVARARAIAERAARLYDVASALSRATTQAEVGEAVLREGVAALGASGGGVLLATGGDRLGVPATIGYDESVVEKLRAESSAAQLPAAVALRTGEPVWLESREERDSLFPELSDVEHNTIAMCAVPLRLAERLLGAIRFSFSEPRLFDHDERRFVLALADLAAQAMDRAELYRERGR